MYAVIETGGKQYRVEKGSTLLVDRLSAEEGSKVDLRPVALLDKKLVVGDDLEKVKVEAKVAGHERGDKIRVFKYRPKKGYRRRAGHRSELTRLEVTAISYSAATKTAAGSKRKPAGASKQAATKKTTEKKPAAKKSTAKKPAAKKETKKSGS